MEWNALSNFLADAQKSTIPLKELMQQIIRDGAIAGKQSHHREANVTIILLKFQLYSVDAKQNICSFYAW